MNLMPKLEFFQWLLVITFIGAIIIGITVTDTLKTLLILMTWPCKSYSFFTFSFTKFLISTPHMLPFIHYHLQPNFYGGFKVSTGDNVIFISCTVTF